MKLKFSVLLLILLLAGCVHAQTTIQRGVPVPRTPTVPLCGLTNDATAKIPSGWSTTQPNGHGNLIAAPTEASDYTDPLGNCVVRAIINRANGPSPTTEQIFPDYAKRASYNLDGTQVALVHNTAGFFSTAVDSNGKRTGSILCTGFSFESWSMLTANKGYYSSGNTLRSVNTSTCTNALVHTFSASYSGNCSLGGGETAVVLSTGNEELVALRCRKAAGDDMVLYNITTDTVSGTVNCGTTTIDNSERFPDGHAMLMGFGGGTGTCLGVKYYNSDGTLNRHVNTFNNGPAHGQAAVVSGNNVVVADYNSSDPCTTGHGILTIRMDNDAATCNVNWQIAAPNAGSWYGHDCHISARGDWALISCMDMGGASGPMALEASLGSTWDNTTTQWGRVGFAEVLLIRLSDNKVWRVLWNWNSSNNFGSDYRAQAHCNLGIATNAAGVPKFAVCAFNFRTGVAGENAYNIKFAD